MSRLLLLVAAVFGATGCAQIIGANDYSVESTGASTGGCVDAKTGCYACAPTTREQFLNACTDAVCVPFDTSKVTALNADGSRPDAPDGTGGATSSSAAATTTTTTDATTTSDASSSSGGGDGCDALPQPIVYVTGSSASKPFLSEIAHTLATQGQLSVVYQSQGSCAGVDAIFDGKRIQGTASYWDAAVGSTSAAEKTCKLTTDSGGARVDIGISDVFATTCRALPQGFPVGIDDTFGPIQAMELVTASSSPETSIDSDAAYFVYGFGSESGVSPWNDASDIFQRTASSGTQNIIAKAIGLEVSKFHGVANASSDAMLASLVSASQSPADAPKSIGMLSADYADTNHQTLRVLAFQDIGQKCAYYPDSTPNQLDKQNVRDGHYPMWGPLHFFTKNPSDGASTLVNYLSGSSTLSGVDVIQLYVGAHVVPRCAMKVSRTADGAELQPFTPDSSCGCAFEVAVGAGSECKACSSPAQCPAEAPTCSFGYCEK